MMTINYSERMYLRFVKEANDAGEPYTLSPATCAKLQSKGLVVGTIAKGFRKKKEWRITAEGIAVLEQAQ